MLGNSPMGSIGAGSAAILSSNRPPATFRPCRTEGLHLGTRISYRRISDLVPGIIGHHGSLHSLSPIWLPGESGYGHD